VRVRLPREPWTVPLARHLVRVALEGRQVNDECGDAIDIAVTEACTNAVCHADPADSYQLRVTVTSRHCLVEVVDDGAGFDLGQVALPAPTALCGRGLVMIGCLVDQLKNGVAALRAPLYDLVSNWAYMVIAALAWNIKSWFAMMMHRKADRRDYLRMEFRRFLTSIILIPAMVCRRARTITVRLIGYTPSIDRLFSAWRTTERTRFG
jgi:anti-sigma regulatory factor (Ser/Thr protein kinase)